MSASSVDFYADLRDGKRQTRRFAKAQRQHRMRRSGKWFLREGIDEYEAILPVWGWAVYEDVGAGRFWIDRVIMDEDEAPEELPGSRTRLRDQALRVLDRLLASVLYDITYDIVEFVDGRTEAAPAPVLCLCEDCP